jgi:hypothetical protein
MKKLFLIIFLLLPTLAFAQSNRNPCVYGVGTNDSATLSNGNCLAVGYYLAGVTGAPMPVGGIANAAAPTFTEGLPGYLSFDLNGNLRTVSSGGGGGGNVNVTQWDTTSLGVPTAYGTAPTTGNYIGVNAFVTNSIAITAASLPLPSGASTSANQTNGSQIAQSEPYQFTPLTPGQYGLTVASSTALTIPTGALEANVCVSGNNVNYTYDGTTTPTASVGLPLLTGQCIQFSGATVLSNLKFIQTAATATLNVGYTK